MIEKGNHGNHLQQINVNESTVGLYSRVLNDKSAKLTEFSSSFLKERLESKRKSCTKFNCVRLNGFGGCKAFVYTD